MKRRLTIDGNNPLCGRHVTFNLNVTMVRDATDEEMAEGGPALPEIDIEGTSKVPV